jgi:hypothetical protein
VKKLKRLFINNHFRKSSVSAAAGFLAFGSHSNAQTIVQDNFTNGTPGGTGLIGLAPSGPNLGGGTWGYTGPNDYDNREFSGDTTDFPSGSGLPGVPNFAAPRNGAAAGVSIQSNGSYVEPDVLTISSGINPIGPVGRGGNDNNITNPTSYLGFFSTTQSSHYQSGTTTNFVGLTLDANGDVGVQVGNTHFGQLNYATGPDAGLPAPAIQAGAGIFNSEGFASLRFDLTWDPVGDDATISNIYINGASTYSNLYFTTGTLSPNTINYAGIGAQADGFTAGGAFTNFNVSFQLPAPVPEPSEYTLILGGALALGASQLRRRRNQV